MLCVVEGAVVEQEQGIDCLEHGGMGAKCVEAVQLRAEKFFEEAMPFAAAASRSDETLLLSEEIGNDLKQRPSCACVNDEGRAVVGVEHLTLDGAEYVMRVAEEMRQLHDSGVIFRSCVCSFRGGFCGKTNSARQLQRIVTGRQLRRSTGGFFVRSKTEASGDGCNATFWVHAYA